MANSLLECTSLAPSHQAACVSIKFSPNNDLFASVSADKTVLLFDARRRQYRGKLEGQHTLGLNDCAFMGDDKLITVSDDKHIIIWDVEQEKMIQKIAGNNSYVTCVAVNPKNGLIISGAYDHQVRMWDHRSRHALFRTLDAHSEPITALDFNEDGVEFLSGSYDGLVRIWQTLGGLCLQNLFLTELPPISGARFINNSYLSISSLDSHLRLWHRTQGESHKGKGRCRQVRMLTGHQNTKHCMLTTACNITRSDGISANFLVSGSEDTNVYLWDLSSRELPAIALEGHCAPVVATASSQNKDLPAMIVSGDLDGQLKMWTASASS